MTEMSVPDKRVSVAASGAQLDVIERLRAHLGLRTRTSVIWFCVFEVARTRGLISNVARAWCSGGDID